MDFRGNEDRLRLCRIHRRRDRSALRWIAGQLRVRSGVGAVGSEALVGETVSDLIWESQQ